MWDYHPDYYHGNGEAEHHGEGGNGGAVDTHGAVDNSHSSSTLPEFGNCDVDGYFHCRNGQMIDCRFRCDDKADCDDDTDEDFDMCEHIFSEPVDGEDEEEEEEDEDIDFNGNGHESHATPTHNEVTESPHYNGDGGETGEHAASYDPYAYEKEQEQERERQRQRELEEEQERNRLYEEQLKREEEEREREYQEQLAREEEEHKRQYELEEQERQRQYELEQQEREREERERAEHERERESGVVPVHTAYDLNNEINICEINPNGYFNCLDGNVIPCEMVCNSSPDCEDGSDEENCRPGTLCQNQIKNKNKSF